ncbi:MAG: inverse autotransporter beta domain-containing protein [Candidatus Omnitrophica bacterium]|jgi:hypothetical protein|nr:inverse autotransporter beta domain-containing protein [Candidatus Omnitrophota bacterium]
MLDKRSSLLTFIISLTVFFLCLVPLSFCQESQESSWFLSSPQDWPSRIRPGMRGGEGQVRHYSDIFIPLFGDQNSFFFFNPKLTLTRHSEVDANEENIGLGYRTLICQDKAILGTNLFYDTRRSDNDVRHDQVGFGLELLSQRFDLRSNLYFPITEKKYLKDKINYGFTSNTLTKYTTPVYEEPLRGLDYEAGILVPFISDLIETRCFVGGYHYFSRYSDDINGLRIRAEITPVPAFTLNLEITDDNISSTKTYVGGYVTLPFSIGNLFNNKNPFEGWKEQLSFAQGPRPIRKRMTDMVIRDLDIRAPEVNLVQESAKEHDVVFVDNSNTSGAEDGSLENPYNTIAEGISNATGDKWIYVKKGNSDYNEQVDISTGVTLWGSRYNGGFSGITTDTGPVVDGTSLGSNIVTVNTNTTLMGFNLQNTTDNHGIAMSAGSSGITISHNNISDLSGDSDGINFVVNGGASDITISDNTITNCGANGILVQGYIGDGTGIYILNNTISTITAGQGISITTALNLATTISDVTISGNNISGASDQGIIIATTNANSTISDVTISRNTATNCNIGILVGATAGTVSDINLGNNATGSGGYNAIYNNTTSDIANGSTSLGATGIANLKAENNYWGGGEPNTTDSADTTDYNPYLTSNPL